MRKTLLLLFLCLFLPLSALASEETKMVRPSLRIINLKTFELIGEIYPFPENSKVEGFNITVADLDNDKNKEIIVAAGRNEKPLIKILNNQGNFKSEFLAYPESYTGGIKAIATDLFNDGLLEIITAQNEKGNTQIRVFDRFGNMLYNFFAFDEKVTGGVNITVGDINLDGQKEIIVAAGYGQEPVVKIFSNYSNFLTSFYAYEKSFNGGVNVLAADLNNDKKDEIITAPALNKEPLIRIYDDQAKVISEFLAEGKNFHGGINLTTNDIENDNKVEIITSPGYGGGAHVRVFDNLGFEKSYLNSTIYPDYKGGISIAVADLNNNQQKQIIASTQTISPLNKYESHSIIEIDLTKQKLFAYYKGVLEKEFIISTGKWKFPTPVGNFRIQSKVEKTNMVRNYGPDNPDNYNLPDVPNVMYFYKGYAIHGAYWHWRFGTRVSHGCVNLKLKDAKWLYNFAEVGTPVNIYASKK
jgi:hypothetical protein